MLRIRLDRKNEEIILFNKVVISVRGIIVRSQIVWSFYNNTHCKTRTCMVNFTHNKVLDCVHCTEVESIENRSEYSRIPFFCMITQRWALPLLFAISRWKEKSANRRNTKVCWDGDVNGKWNHPPRNILSLKPSFTRPWDYIKGGGLNLYSDLQCTYL